MLPTRGTADPAAVETLLQEPRDAAIVVVAVGAMVMAALAGAMTARSDYSTERALLRSQWPSRPAGPGS